MATDSKKVMVIGGGIAGLTAAWELSQFDIDVELIEKSCFLGGHAIQFCCKATDECVVCGACSVEDMLKKVVNQPRIHVHLATQVAALRRNGAFQAQLEKSAVPAGSAGVLTGYSKNNQPLVVIADTAQADSASKDAVAWNDLGASGCIDVDAVVLASGFQPFDARTKGTYGYQKFPNVVTGLDLERIKRTRGAIVRPSDGQAPKKIAFIQCVGSRDERLGNLWCSHVCCPYALRMAQDLKHADPEAQITVFYMDIQNTNKNFPMFYDKCRADMTFVRNIPVDVYPEDGDRLRMRFLDDADGAALNDTFDMIVLSIGIAPGADNAELAKTTGIELNADGFFTAADAQTKTATSQHGIFLAGTVEGPRTIAASIAHAGQAASDVINHLGVSHD